jgi:hypothetical protein
LNKHSWHSTGDIPTFIGVKSDGKLPDIENTLEMDMRFCDERTTVLNGKEMKEESKMQVNEIQLKVIALGLVPVFLILTFALPKTASTAILLGSVMITGFVVCFIGMSMQKQEAKNDEDLLEIPPKKRS